MHEGVERNEGQAEPLRQVQNAYVALYQCDAPGRRSSQFCHLATCHLQHPLRQVHACDLEAGARQRHKQPAGTAAQLKDRPAGVLGQAEVEGHVVLKRIVVQIIEAGEAIEVGHEYLQAIVLRATWCLHRNTKRTIPLTVPNNRTKSL